MTFIQEMTMRRKRASIKNVLIFIIIVGTIPVSYFYSRKIYSFYMRSYYEKIRGQSIGQLVRKGREMYDNKQYALLSEYLKTLVIVYPDNKELKILEGLTYIKLGRGDIGSDIILSATNGEKLPEPVLEETIRTLYDLKQYKDIIMTMKKNNAAGSPGLLYYYGTSLLNTGNYKAAIPVLQQALQKGRAGYETYLNIGIAYSKINEPRAALPFLERARAMNNNRDTAGALADTYWRLGRYKDAEKILSKMKK